jgi:glycosyltransferase involved in cell wall biosynthesis
VTTPLRCPFEKIAAVDVKRGWEASMKVLHVIPGLGSSTGGPAVIVVELSAALEAYGVESTIFSTDLPGPASSRNHYSAKESDLPERVREVDVQLFPARWPYRLAFSPAMYFALRRETPRYDVLHIHSLFLFPQFAAFRQAKQCGVPYVVSQHGALDPNLRRRGRRRKAVVDLLWQRQMLKEAAALHVLADEEERTIADIVPSVRRIVVPAGIRWSDYEELRDGDDFRRLRLGGFKGPIVMNIGRLAWKKGLDILIRAFAIAARSVPEARLVLAGPDDERLGAALLLLAQREGIAERITFTGMLHREEIRAALAAADVWALPSRADAFPMAVMEALAAGKAIVISPAVNTAPDIAAAGAGVICNAEPEAFAAQIVSLLSDKTHRAELQQKARAFARRFDWMSVAPQWIEMYSEVAAPQ